jgi:hypothetical protein
MQNRKVALATIVGIVLFIADINTGFISLTLGIPSIFLIVFVVGIIAGDGVSGFIAGILTEGLSITLLAAIPQILMPEYSFESDNILTRMIVIMMISVAYGTHLATDPIPWVVAPIIILLLLIIAPMFFAIALLFGPLGGLVGKAIYSRLLGPSEPDQGIREPPYDSGLAPEPSEPPSEDPPEQQAVPEMEGEPLETEGETTEGIGTHKQVDEDTEERR